MDSHQHCSTAVTSKCFLSKAEQQTKWAVDFTHPECRFAFIGNASQWKIAEAESTTVAYLEKTSELRVSPRNVHFLFPLLLGLVITLLCLLRELGYDLPGQDNLMNVLAMLSENWKPSHPCWGTYHQTPSAVGEGTLNAL